MILVFGGTTEGRLAVKTLEEAGKPFYYSTKGKEQEISLHQGIRLQGAMTAGDVKLFCAENRVRLIVDAAHPFAEQLHATLSEVMNETGIPVIRFERIFPERDEEHLIWCDNYEDALRRISDKRINKLLFLTGVQSIAKLKTYWQNKTDCYFRILDRESSRLIAREQGLSESRICYYHAGENECSLLKRLRPEAILTKESGVSGGFLEKVQAARDMGIQVFVLKRPKTPQGFVCVNGENGLRRKVERLLPEFFDLHSGLTTGTCATAASVAAVWRMLHPGQTLPKVFFIELPNGESIDVPVHTGDEACSAYVIKDSGDDPDITNGTEIWASVQTLSNQEGNVLEDDFIQIHGGKGVGTVTLPGLGLEIGKAAINQTPRQMIKRNVESLFHRSGISPFPISIILSLPAGEELARRTFNPRLGIEGGISIIGTSGIVKPFSSEAFVNSIRQSMKVAQATSSERIVISSGAKSERYIKAYYPELPQQAFVHYGNFIGETIKIADELDIRQMSLGIMIGKAVKLAEGFLDTHSKKVTMNKTFIRLLAEESGCDAATLDKIESMTLARELWEVLPKECQKKFCHRLSALCYQQCASLFPKGRLTVLLITENGDIACEFSERS